MTSLMVVGEKIKKAWMVNKDYSRKGAYYAVLRALYDAEHKNLANKFNGNEFRI